MSLLRMKAYKIIDNISDKKINEIVDFLKFLKVKEELGAINEILNDETILAAVKKGLKNIED